MTDDPDVKQPELEVQIIPDDADTKKQPPKADDDDEDYGEYSAKVQKRIAKEVKRRHDAERDRDAERSQRAQIEQQLKNAGTRIDRVDQQAVDAEERRILAEISKAQRDFREAREKGDVDGESTALAAIAEAKADKKAIDMYKADRKLPGTRQQQPEQQQEQPQQRQKAHPLAEEWKSDNETWFEKQTPVGRRMTTMAYAIDQELAEEGYDLNSPDYYAELTKRVRQQFPDYFKKPAGRQQPVAEVSRATPHDKKPVRITESAAATAHKLGLTVAQYSAYVRTNDE